MQLERLQSMDYNDNRKTQGINSGIADDDSDDGSSNADHDDLNDRMMESTDPIEEFLRDFTASDEMSEDDLFNLDDKVGQDQENVQTSPPALSQMPSKITEVSGDLLDDTFDDR